jgi:hypothetical protein
MVRSIALVFILTLSAVVVPSALAFPITDTATTIVLYEGMLSELNGKINTAFSQGNYLVWSAGVQARLAIERWGEVNRELLDKAFKDLNDSQQRFFRNMNDLVSHFEASATRLTKEAQALLDQLQQTVADVKFWDGQPVVLGYAPTLFLLEKRTPKTIR